MSVMDGFRLDGQVALITGAGRGIGRAIALAFAEAGADVVCAARTAAQVEDTASQARKLGVRAHASTCDVADETARAALVAEALETMGKLSVLVNNAGGAGPNNPMKMSAEAFAGVLNWNVVPAYDFTGLCVPHFHAAGGGSVINISSMAGRLRQRGFSAYGSAKAALTHLTRLLAQDFAPTVRVNAIEPGAIMTDALASVMDDQQKDHLVKTTPLGRLGQPEDIAAAAVYLASPAAAWVTGKVLEVDGGVEAPQW